MKIRIIIIKRRKIHPVNHRSPGDRGRRSVRRRPYPRPAPARGAWDAVAVCRMRTRRLVGQPCIPLLAKADAFERMGRRSRRSGDRPRSPPRERAVRAGSPRQRPGPPAPARSACADSGDRGEARPLADAGLHRSGSGRHAGRLEEPLAKPALAPPGRGSRSRRRADSRRATGSRSPRREAEGEGVSRRETRRTEHRCRRMSASTPSAYALARNLMLTRCTSS